MKFPLKSIPAFLLFLGGVMGVGAFLNFYNTVGEPVTAGGIAFTLVLAVYAYIGYYCYTYLAYGKGNAKVALGMAVITSILGIVVMIGGWSDDQKFFTLYELINYIAPLFITAILVQELRS